MQIYTTYTVCLCVYSRLNCGLFGIYFTVTVTSRLQQTNKQTVNEFTALKETRMITGM